MPLCPGIIKPLLFNLYDTRYPLPRGYVLSVNPIYDRLCPSCGREADVESILEHGVCKRCLVSSSDNVFNLLKYNESIENEINCFEEFFSQVTKGYRLWGSQRIWLKRLFRGENTAIIAPTGIGKTTLLTAYALYMSYKYGRKILFLSPTTSLAKQIHNRLTTMRDSIGASVKIVFYDSSVSRKKKEAILERIVNGDYDILILTNTFVSRRPDVVDSKSFNIVIADDVDSLLNRSRNTLRLLKMLGYSDEEIKIAKELSTIRNKLLILRVNGLDEQYMELFKTYIEYEDRLRELRSRKSYGQIIISSATGRARGPYISILRELLELDITGITVYARDITDSYKLVDSVEEALETLYRVVKELGSGGIILISSYHPIKRFITINDLVDKLGEATGLSIVKATVSNVKKLVEGKVDVVVGSASYYGVSVRGIDSPENIRYVVFLGTPCFVVELLNLLSSIKLLYRVLIYLRENEYDVVDYLKSIAYILRYATHKELRILKDLLRDKITVDDITSKKVIEWYNTVKEVVSKVYVLIKKIIDKNKVISIGTITLYRDRDRYVGLIPDLMTYIQASGRTSRLYNGSMTHGLSIIIESRELSPLISSLEIRFKFLNKDISFKSLENIDLVEEREIIYNTRRERRGSWRIGFKNVLLVVESPTKARTIASFFGKPARRKIGSINVYEVPIVRDNEVVYLNIVATRGHIFDLTTDPSKGLYGVIIGNNVYQPYYTTIKRCRICGYQFTYGSSCIRCGSTSITDSIEVVNVLRKLASEVDEILIGTDPDNEGEKIAFDIYLVVHPINKNVYRVEFHEVTPRELYSVLDKRRSINVGLVYSQIFRRVMDRLVGFSLSHRLWSVFGKHWLGAGRVQTPVLGWIIEGYRRWRESRCYVVEAITGFEKPFIKARLYISDRDEATRLYNELYSKGFVEIVVKGERVETVNPKPPYTTDTLLQDMARYGIPAVKTMKIAQELFESGLITYHRTDSTHVSSTGIEVANRYLGKRSMEEYFTPRHWGSRGTHEAIRPTNPWDRSDLEKAVSEGLINIPVYLTPLHLLVYDKIFRRFISSQMKPYRVLVRSVKVYFNKEYYVDLEIPVKVIDNGFNIVDEPVIYGWLGTLSIGELKIPIRDLRKRRSSRHPLPSQGDIVKRMKKEGIGRPSTYATVLNTIRRHGYIIESKKKRLLIPTKTGVEVYGYLIENYSDLVSVSTTRFMEELIDKISSNAMELSRALDILVNMLCLHNLVTIHKLEQVVGT